MVGKILVTGFEPYGSFDYNPSAEVAKAVDDIDCGGGRVVSRILPVNFATNHSDLRSLIEAIDPILVLSFGLHPEEEMIRIERLGINLADFDMPDNAGAKLAEQPIEPGAELARMTTLPCSRIKARLIAAGIPARISNTAGLYLCNATLFSALGLCAARPRPPLCGFVHLPYATRQAAAMLAQGTAVVPSMAIETMIDAAKIIIRVSLEASAAV